MRIGVVGTGYVGLVTGTCFAENGHQVVCADVDRSKIDALKANRLPIYEPGLPELVLANQQAGRLRFTTDLAQTIEESAVLFIAVGTPQNEDGSCNLQYVWNVAEAIRRHASERKIVVVKSTVPVGTNAELLRRLNQDSPIRHLTASNPEFLREGLAVADCLNPERIVVGVRGSQETETMRQLYASYIDGGTPFLALSPESAEMTKYVANCILAARISFINEMAGVCEQVGADITQVRQAIGLDSRIGSKFLNAGIGYGGSCFPKDTRAMVALARQHGLELQLLPQVDVVNEQQKERFFEKLVHALDGSVAGKTVAIWGLAFKPETDDIREAPSLLVINRLLENGATVQAFDPQAMDHMRAVVGDRVRFARTPYDALRGADVLGIVTEWSDFEQPDFERMRAEMSRHIIVDGRNMFDPQRMAAQGFVYVSIGRATARPHSSASDRQPSNLAATSPSG